MAVYLEIDKCEDCIHCTMKNMDHPFCSHRDARWVELDEGLYANCAPAKLVLEDAEYDPNAAYWVAKANFNRY